MYQIAPIGTYFTTVLPNMDFETKSEAGYTFINNKWKAQSTKGGLSAVGAMMYSLHPSTEIISLAYDLKDGLGSRLWLPSMSPPQDLFEHLSKGGLIESHNCTFEHHIWNNVGVPKYGFPPLDYRQQRDSMAKCRAFSLPGALGKAVIALGLPQEKDIEGKRLIKKFCVPRNPTKGNPSTWIKPEEDFQDAIKFYAYNIQDIASEAALSSAVPDLIPGELEFWLNTCKSNYLGVGVDIKEVESCISILEQAYEKYNGELENITGGRVTEASKVAQLQAWCADQGIYMADFDNAAIASTLAREDLPPHVRRAIEIRKAIGSAGVKKVYTMQRLATPKGRLHDLFIYHGARTGRDTGADVQPQNLVKAGPKVTWCGGCNKPHSRHHKEVCPHCGGAVCLLGREDDWSWEAVEHALDAIHTHSLDYVEHIFGDAVLTISGCIRGLFVAGEGKQLIASDYSAIEAVVLAQLAEEQWRIETFQRKEDIYLRSASSITGTLFEDYLQYKKDTGGNHPDRQKIGKVAELASGYAGWVGAWKNFGADKHHTDEQIKQHIIAWREASPAIVELWGGQVRGKPWAPERFEYYGLEGAVVQAILNIGTCYAFKSISFGVKDDVLYCRLPSGRNIVYHRPRLHTHDKYEGQYSISYEGWNSNPLMGPIGWHRLNTYSGRLAENVTQAVARDIMAFAVNNLERAGYPVVLRIHDEIVSEVPIGFGSIEEFETIMATLPPWAEGWAIRASGGWVGKRYRKD